MCLQARHTQQLHQLGALPSLARQRSGDLGKGHAPASGQFSVAGESAGLRLRLVHVCSHGVEIGSHAQPSLK